MSLTGGVVALALYFLLYSVIHSILASTSVKNWSRHTFGASTDYWYRLSYNIFATITLLPVLAIIVLLPGQTLYVASSPWRWLMLGGQILAVIAIVITLLQTGLFHFIGLSQLVSGRSEEKGPLNVSGFYAWVRHPLYTFSIVFIWLSPVMSTTGLSAFILFTAYFFIGSIYEERRLLAEHGPVYEAYCRQVPRIIPVPGRKYMPTGEQEQAKQ